MGPGAAVLLMETPGGEALYIVLLLLLPLIFIQPSTFSGRNVEEKDGSG
jgi:hypothetical protein